MRNFICKINLTVLTQFGKISGESVSIVSVTAERSSQNTIAVRNKPWYFPVLHFLSNKQYYQTLNKLIKNVPYISGEGL